MGILENYWDKGRLLRAGQYVASVPQFTQYDIDLAHSLGIDLNTESDNGGRNEPKG